MNTQVPRATSLFSTVLLLIRPFHDRPTVVDHHVIEHLLPLCITPRTILQQLCAHKLRSTLDDALWSLGDGALWNEEVHFLNLHPFNNPNLERLPKPVLMTWKNIALC